MWINPGASLYLARHCYSRPCNPSQCCFRHSNADLSPCHHGFPNPGKSQGPGSCHPYAGCVVTGCGSAGRYRVRYLAAELPGNLAPMLRAFLPAAFTQFPAVCSCARQDEKDQVQRRYRRSHDSAVYGDLFRCFINAYCTPTIRIS